MVPDVPVDMAPAWRSGLSVKKICRHPHKTSPSAGQGIATAGTQQVHDLRMLLDRKLVVSCIMNIMFAKCRHAHRRGDVAHREDGAVVGCQEISCLCLQRQDAQSYDQALAGAVWH